MSQRKPVKREAETQPLPERPQPFRPAAFFGAGIVVFAVALALTVSPYVGLPIALLGVALIVFPIGRITCSRCGQTGYIRTAAFPQIADYQERPPLRPPENLGVRCRNCRTRLAVQGRWWWWTRLREY